MAELPPITINNPKSKQMTIMGSSHHFFLSLRKLHKSLINSIDKFLKFISSQIKNKSSNQSGFKFFINDSLLFCSG